MTKKRFLLSPRLLTASTLVLGYSLVTGASAQDLSTIAITAPVSACAPTGFENVAIKLFNYGTNLPAGTAFNASYTINAGAPVTEMITLGSTLLANSTMAYTFVTQVNLSVPGTYTFDATVSIAGDINPTNNALAGWQVTTWAPSIGGTITGPGAPASSGTLTLGGYTGSILQWEESDDGGLRWFVLANTQPSQDYADLRAPVQFRARVQNGECAAVLSNAVIVSP